MLDDDSLARLGVEMQRLRDGGLEPIEIRRRLERAGCTPEDMDLLQPLEAKAQAPSAGFEPAQTLGEAVADLLPLLKRALPVLRGQDWHQRQALLNELQPHIIKCEEALHEASR